MDTEQKLPVLVFLHGLDKVHPNMDVLKEEYPLIVLEDQEEFPFIVVAPKGEGEYEFWATDEMVSAVMMLLDEIQTVVPVDSSRIYLRGLTQGGTEPWRLAYATPIVLQR